MANKRFQEMGIDSSFGHFIYERIVPRDHLLVQLVGLIDCDAIGGKVVFVHYLMGGYNRLTLTYAVVRPTTGQISPVSRPCTGRCTPSLRNSSRSSEQRRAL